MTNSFFVLISLAICNGLGSAADGRDASALVGQDLHLAAPVMVVCQQPEQAASQPPAPAPSPDPKAVDVYNKAPIVSSPPVA